MWEERNLDLDKVLFTHCRSFIPFIVIHQVVNQLDKLLDGHTGAAVKIIHPNTQIDTVGNDFFLVEFDYILF